MTALHPEGLKAALAAYRDHVPGSSPHPVEKIVTAYLALAQPASMTSPEESARFPGLDGTMMVSVLVARSVPFAKALLHEWSLLDGMDRGYLLKAKSISLPASVFDGLLPKVRDRLRPGGLDE